MVLLRRLLTGLLAVALMQFGALASAPAHAHAGGADHGVREIVVAHGHSDFEQPGNEHGHGDNNDDDHHEGPPDAVAGSDGSAPASNDPGHGEHAHVHGLQQFAPSDEAGALFIPTVYVEVLRPIDLTRVVSHSTYPPRRPPRAFL